MMSMQHADSPTPLAPSHRVCTKCHAVKRLDDFYRVGRGTWGHDYWCADCRRADRRRQRASESEAERVRRVTKRRNRRRRIRRQIVEENASTSRSVIRALAARGWSYQQIADAIDRARSMISQIANGKRNPSTETANRLADLLARVSGC